LADDDLVATRPSILDEIDKRRFVSRTASKWGDGAGELMWKRNQDRRLSAVLVALTYLVAVATDLPRFLIVVGIVLSVVVAARSFMLSRKMYETASLTLGVSVSRGKGNHPSTKPEEYEQWCSENGLKPYSASRRFVVMPGSIR
jgi:hypothetical protein